MGAIMWSLRRRRDYRAFLQVDCSASAPCSHVIKVGTVDEGPALDIPLDLEDRCALLALLRTFRSPK